MIKMNYQEIELEEIIYPQSSFEEFCKIAKDCVADFTKNNPIIESIDRGTFSVEEYHKLLLTLFHQVYYSSSSFGLAGTMVDSRFYKVREYLMEHAEEEKGHWMWIINDLRKTGYKGPDPRSLFPAKPTQSYLAFAMFLGLKHPVSRLAMGYILEDLSGKFGVLYGGKVADLLSLNRDQVSFTVQHGELDEGHSDDILQILKDAELTPFEWAHCCHTAKMTIELYKDMYRYASSQEVSHQKPVFV